MAQKYDLTLNLPKTDFPMRAGLPKREPDMLKHWEELDIYNEMLKKNEGKPINANRITLDKTGSPSKVPGIKNPNTTDIMAFT